jgi:uncharacterized damage-inducible protein DinB
MLADQLRKLFQFNDWAWGRTFSSVNSLDEAAYHASRQLFDGTVHKTLVHCLSAEYIWLERCNGRSPNALFDPRDFADARAIEERWTEITSGWWSLLSDLDDADFKHLITYRNTRGEAYSLPLKDICQHVINHATEHRSQLTPYLFAAGYPTDPLDYMLFCLQLK